MRTYQIPLSVSNLLKGMLGVAAGAALTLTFARSVQARVLLIGDSHSVGAYGRELERLFRESEGSEHVALYASCGSSPGSWLSGRPTRCGYREKVGLQREVSVKSHATPLAERVISEWIKPGTEGPSGRSVIVVSHGSNLVPKSLKQTEKEMRAFRDVLERTTSSESTVCYWVGAPDSRTFSDEKTAQTVDVIRASLGGRCTFIDSRVYTSYPANGGDGLHFDSLGAKGREQAKAWAKGVFSQMSTR